MSGRVLGLDGHPAAVPNGDVIEGLEELIRQAKSGQVIGFAAAIVSPGDDESDPILYSVCQPGEAYKSQILASITLLQHYFLRNAFDDPD